MAASYQAKDVMVLGQQLKVQELVIPSTSPLITNDGTNLVVAINEPVAQVLACLKVLAAGGVSAIVCSTSGTNKIGRAHV